jgi:hypothetical protein
MRETLLKLKEEVGVCLMRLDSAVDGLMGRHKYQAQPNRGVIFTSKPLAGAFKPKIKATVFKPKSNCVFY